jgi:hypothetical protein
MFTVLKKESRKTCFSIHKIRKKQKPVPEVESDQWSFVPPLAILLETPSTRTENRITRD